MMYTGQVAPDSPQTIMPSPHLAIPKCGSFGRMQGRFAWRELMWSVHEAGQVSNITDFIDETLRAAGRLLCDFAGATFTVSDKLDTSVVTDADLASEKLILTRIADAFPKDATISEEAGKSTVERIPGQAVWVIDPLDGTTNFANGYPYWCVSIARGRFDERGKIQVEAGGVIDPLRQLCWVAEAGRGTWCGTRRLILKSPRPLSKCLLVTGFYYTKGERLSHEIRRFERIAQACQSIRRDGAAALDMALVANGTFDAFWEHGLQIWDLAAGALLIQEAGGVVRNYGGGSDWDLEGEGVICGQPSVVLDLASMIDLPDGKSPRI